MTDQVKNDIIVVAREGYSVLLNIDGRTLDIDCHEAVNLSSMFTADVLERSSSLSTHLDDGNLVYCDKDIKLSKDTTAIKKITLLRPEKAQHIVSQYTQAERDVSRTNMELETRANITAETRKQIQDQVQVSKKEILQADQKFVNTIQTVNETTTVPKERQNAMTADELQMKVTMDIDPEEFTKKQADAKVAFDASDAKDEERAETEIIFQENNEENNNEENNKE